MESDNDDLPPEGVRKAFDLLIDDGYFNDENSGLGAYCVEHRREKVELALRKLGYDGPELALGGHFYPAWGAVYWMYNPGQISYSGAKQLTDEWVITHQNDAAE